MLACCLLDVPLLCVHLIFFVWQNASNIAKKKKTMSDFAGCSRAFGDYMHAAESRWATLHDNLQGDNVKLKMVVDCDRLVLVCVLMQKRWDSFCVWKAPAAFGDPIVERKALQKACSLLSQFSATFGYHVCDVMDEDWYSGHIEKPYVFLDYNARVTFSGFRPRL